MVGERQMSRRKLWVIIVSLALINIGIVVTTFLNQGREDMEAITHQETVASIGDDIITRQQWLSELETRYGKQTLKDMVDEKVVRQLADKYKVDISNHEIERELTMMRSMYNPINQPYLEDDQWREQVELSLLYEELLTRDAVISKEEMQSYYNQNKDLYDIPETYHLSHITVKSLSDAEQVVTELENGSSFAALAREKSLDDFSASRGGELGYIASGSEYVPKEYVQVAKTLEEGEWSQPIKIKEDYAILLSHEFIKGVSFSFDEVKNQIRRQIAMDQMNHSIAVQSLWKDAEVSWFYGSEQ
jgi:foldase protein PrsA